MAGFPCWARCSEVSDELVRAQPPGNLGGRGPSRAWVTLRHEDGGQRPDSPVIGARTQRSSRLYKLTGFFCTLSRVRWKASGRPRNKSVATSECSPTLSRMTSPAIPCRCTAARTASKACFGFCAIMPATMPVRMSPVPPVAMPGLPVVLPRLLHRGARPACDVL